MIQTRGFKFNGVSFACGVAGLIACGSACLGLHVILLACDTACGVAFAAGCAFT